MNIQIYIWECIIMCLMFTLLTQTLLFISPLTFISDFPPEIQEEYYRSQNKQAQRETLSLVMKIKKIIAIIFFMVVFAWMAHIAGASSFIEGLLCVYGYIVILLAYDTFFLDWVLFANIKRIRLPGTEHMEKEYHQKWFHVKVCIPMIPVFLIGGVFISGLMIWIW